MSTGERDEELFHYIAESISLIGRYTAAGRETFLHDEMVQDAVLRRLETLADATRHLSDEVKSRHPTIEWRAIYGFRNVAAHGYLALDLDRVWVTLEYYLPVLRSAVTMELTRFDKPDRG